MLIRQVVLYMLPIAVVLLSSCTAPPLEVAAAELENGVQGADYSRQLVSAGEAPLHWSISHGKLPSGLVLNSAGQIVGQPEEPGDFNFSVRVRDSSFPARSGEQAYSLTVLPRLRISIDLQPARVFEAYQATPMVEGGVPPYIFEVIGLPAGLGVDPETGTISGVPLTPYRALRVESRVSDSGQPQQTAAETSFLDIKDVAVQIITTDLPAGRVGVYYEQRVMVQGGLLPYSWAVSDGELPTSLHLNIATGVIFGTPTKAETSTFTIRVVDADSPATMDTAEFTIETTP